MSDYKVIWQKCLDIIRENVSESNFNTWFAPIEVLDLDDNVLKLSVPTWTFVEKLENQFYDVLESAMHTVIGPNAGLEYKYGLSDAVITETSKKPAVQLGGGWEQMDAKVMNPFAVVGKRQLNIDPELNSDFTFDNYIVGDGNKFAYSLAISVAQNPGENPFNPLFVYGSSGVGKTHLIQAIGAAVKTSDPTKNVVYLSADRFTRQYMDAVKGNAINLFMNFYQMIDVLIVDDIQEIAGRAGSVNVFFQIFNHLQQNKKQIIMAADKKPAEMQGIEERMLSRFKSGVVVEVQMPDYDTRVKIIKNKVTKDGVQLPEDIISYVANNVSGSVRELEGSLCSMLAFATLYHEDITMDVARQAVSNLVKTEVKEINVDNIIKSVCQYYNVDVAALQKNTRKSEIVLVRQVAMYLCKEFTQASLSAIGMKLGNKSHATVLYSCKAVKNLLDTDTDFAKQVKNISNMIRG
ncbi:MAG: chromosomal replication initiator protein DnaA [Bacteroidales bacterium]|nr:chromosomal replication initiator protein DnaA [Bacteroidales bacterium]